MGGNKIDPRDIFSPSAGRYLVSSDHQSGPDLEVITRVAEQLHPSVTVDIASGAGHALRAASPWSGVSAALDLTFEMLKVAREHLQAAGLEDVHFLQSAADRLPLADSTVSLLTCRIAPHHFSSVSGFLDEVVRVLEPTGCSIIIDSIAPGEPGSDRFINAAEQFRDPSHVRTHTLRQWLEYLDSAGLEVISVQLFERTHAFHEWASRTGLDENDITVVEKMFRDAPKYIRDRFKVHVDSEGKVESYTDEKGIFVLKKR